MLYTTMVTVRRVRSREPAGVTQVRVTTEIEAPNWATAADMATESVLDQLNPLLGGLAGSRIQDIQVEAGTRYPDR